MSITGCYGEINYCNRLKCANIPKMCVWFNMCVFKPDTLTIVGKKSELCGANKQETQAHCWQFLKHKLFVPGNSKQTNSELKGYGGLSWVRDVLAVTVSKVLLLTLLGFMLWCEVWWTGRGVVGLPLPNWKCHRSKNILCGLVCVSGCLCMCVYVVHMLYLRVMIWPVSSKQSVL